MPSLEFTTTVELPTGEEVEVKVAYDAVYQEAYISGPPEDCYPAEGELTLTACTPPLPPEFDSVLEDRAWEHFHDHR